MEGRPGLSFHFETVIEAVLRTRDDVRIDKVQRRLGLLIKEPGTAEVGAMSEAPKAQSYIKL